MATARQEGSIIKCVVVRCSHSNCKFAHVVPFKGNDKEQYIANLVTADLAWLGNTRLILKSDREATLVSLLTRIWKTAKVQ